MGNRVEVEFAVLDKLSAHVKQMNDTVGGFARNTEKSFAALTKGFVAFAAIGGIAATIKGAVTQSMALAEQIHKTSEAFGMSTTAVQQWRFVAQQSDVNADSLYRMFKMLGIQVAKTANDVETNKGALNKLGVATKDAGGHLRNTNDIFKDTIVKLTEIENPLMRAGVAQSIFGKSSGELLPLLSKSREEIEALIGKADVYGQVLSSNTVRQLDEAKKASEAFNTASKNLGANLTVFATPIIKGLALEFAAFTTAGSKAVEFLNYLKLKAQGSSNEFVFLAGNIEKAVEAGDKESLKRMYADISKQIDDTRVKINQLEADEKEYGFVPALKKKKKEFDDLCLSIDMVIKAQEKLNTKPPPPPDDPDAAEQAIKDAQYRAKVTKKAEDDAAKQSLDDYRTYVKYKEKAELNTLVLVENEKRKNEDNDKKIADRIIKDGIKGKQKVQEFDQEISESKVKGNEKEKEFRREDIADNIAGIGSVFSAFATANKRSAQEKKNIARVEALINTAVGITRAIPNPFLIAFAATTGIAQQGAISNANFVSGIRDNKIGTWATFGEQGPEKGFLPAGASVFNNSETRNMDNSQSTVFHAHFYNSSGDEIETFRAKIRSGAADQLVRDLQNKMARSL